MLFSNGFSFSRGFPKMASEIFLAIAGVLSSRGSSPNRCFPLLFWRNSLISSTSSGTGMREESSLRIKTEYIPLIERDDSHHFPPAPPPPLIPPPNPPLPNPPLPRPNPPKPVPALGDMLNVVARGFPLMIK